MPAKTLAAFLAGALAASTGTAAALTNGHIFRLQDGDEANYGTITCEAHGTVNAAAMQIPGGFGCFGLKRYTITYSPSEVRVFRWNAKNVSKTVFVVNPSGQ
jgi:hypothetical protein